MTCLLANIFDTKDINIEHSSRVKITAEFLKSRTIDIYEIDDVDFFYSNIPEVRLARFTFYHILRKYTGISHQLIGKYYECYGMNKRKAIYACHECERRLTSTSFQSPQDKVFKNHYKVIESHLIQFITKITPQQK